ncbi:hypothetical protein BC629DRAFT_1444987 [Irpex lacteus]|nr:hypothetical protein BC629DRAFT_1444987 [Irpex lacteus]
MSESVTSARKRKPSTKQAVLDAASAERQRRAQEKTQPKQPRNVQTAARKVTAATSGSITTSTVPTLVKKTIVPTAVNKGSVKPRTITATSVSRSESHKATNTSTRQRSSPYLTGTRIQGGRAATKSSAPTAARRNSSPPAPLPADEVEAERDDDQQEGSFDDEEVFITDGYASSGPQVPSSEPASDNSDGDDDDEHQPLPPRTNREYASPSPDPYERPSRYRRPVSRYTEDNGSPDRLEEVVPSMQYHKRMLSDSSATSTQPQKIQKVVQHNGRPRRSDFKAVVQELIKSAQNLMKAKLYMLNAFPSTTEQEEWITEIWEEVTGPAERAYEKTTDIHRILLHCATELRSHVKPISREVVTGTYGFTDTKSRQANKELYDKLQGKPDEEAEDSEDTVPCWLFPTKEFDKPPSERMKVYYTEALTSFTNKSIYEKRSRSRIGIRYPDLIGEKLTLEHVAFNLTMIEFALSEWEDGSFSDKTLTHDAGEIMYRAHIVNLGKYKQSFGNDNFNRMCARLVRKGRDHAGLGPLNGAGKGTVPLSAFKRMAARAAADGFASGSDDEVE